MAKKTTKELIIGDYLKAQKFKEDASNKYLSRLDKIKAELEKLRLKKANKHGAETPEDYLKLMVEIRKTEDLEDYYKSQLESLEIAPYQDGFETLIKRIEQEIIEMDNRAIKKVLPLLGQIRKTLDESENDLGELNDILKNLCMELGSERIGQAKYVKMRNGLYMPSVSTLSNKLNSGYIEELKEVTK